MVVLPLAYHSVIALCFYCRSGCLLADNSSPLPGSALQTPCSSTQPPSAPADTRLRLDMQGCGTDHLCRSHSVLPATDGLLHSPLIAPETPLLSQLISLPVRGLPQVWEPLVSFSSPLGVQVLSCFLSSSFSLLLSFILPGYVEIFLVLSGVQGPLLVYCSCSVRLVPFVDVFLMHLWGEMNSTSSYFSSILTPFVCVYLY